ncbi:MAG: aromatic amino acid lyase [Thermoleophilia bacterium]
MTVQIDGSHLTVDDVERVARRYEPAELTPAALTRMASTRAIVEQALARGDEVYGLTTGVGTLKRTHVSRQEEAGFNRRLLANHRVAQGPLVATDIARAALLRMAAGFAGGHSGVRPALAMRLIDLLNAGTNLTLRLYGSLGQSDLAANADLAATVFADFDPAPGEGLAILNNNAFATGYAALAVADSLRFLNAVEAVGALSLEAFAANLTTLHPIVAATRPYPGLATAVARLRALLTGSYLWQPGSARNLQDPLSFRNLAQQSGAARDALAHVLTQVTIELNSAQGNPLVVPDEGRLISAGQYEVLPLAAALDYARIALAPLLTSTSERILKLLDTPWSGLPTGLAARPGTADSGLSHFGIAAEALTAEARLLAQPVSFELVSTTGAEGIEDRTTMAPLAARRLADMVGLSERVLAIGLLVAARAVQLRGKQPLGSGTARLWELVRERVPTAMAGDTLPDDLEPLRQLVGSGALSVLGA